MDEKLCDIFDSMTDAELIEISDIELDCPIDEETVMRIQKSVLAKTFTTNEKDKKGRKRWRSLVSIAACFALVMTITVIANAATDGAVFESVKRVFIGNSELVITETESALHVKILNEAESEWLAEDVSGNLILNVNEEEIDITESLASNGYYYYDYFDDGDILHRVYIVKNIGETDTERWYSQIELIIFEDSTVGSLSTFGKLKGCGAELANVIGIAQNDAVTGKGDLDTLLGQYLKEYWDKYQS